MSLQHQISCAHVILAAVFEELDLERRRHVEKTASLMKKTGHVTNVTNQCMFGTHKFLDGCWPAFIQHWTALCVVDLKP